MQLLAEWLKFYSLASLSTTKQFQMKFEYPQKGVKVLTYVAVKSVLQNNLIENKI